MALNELTRNKCQKSLDYIKQIITSSPMLDHPDCDKQYYLFVDSWKHSWCGVLVHYD